MTYRVAECFNHATGAFVGYLGTHGNYTTIVTSREDASLLKWGEYGGDTYLVEQASPSTRYLGDGGGDLADWGLWSGNYAAPVLYNRDGTVSLAATPNRRLRWPSGQDRVYWSADSNAADPDMLVVELNHPRAWMRDLSPATLIGEINLPGTHDSAAIKPGIPDAYSCHKRTITQQLEAGVRLLDVRLLIDQITHPGGPATYEFQTCHGNVGLGRRAHVYQTFPSLLEECRTFLTDYPTEFIAMSLKIDDQNAVPDVDLPDVLTALDALLASYGVHPWTGDMPSLQTMQGRVYLLDRILPALLDPARKPPLAPYIRNAVKTHSYGVSLDIPDNTTGDLLKADSSRTFDIYVQDMYENLPAPPITAIFKFGLFTFALSKKPAQGVLFNFASATFLLSGVYIQGMVAEYIAHTKPTKLGWSLYDYEEEVFSTDLGDLTVVELIVASNLGYRH